MYESIIGDFSTGVMIAFSVPVNTARALLPGPDNLPVGSEIMPSDQLHITLAYLGKVIDQAYDRADLEAVLAVFADRRFPITGRINGIGQFNAGDNEMCPLYANFDSPQLPAFRQDLIAALGAVGAVVNEAHGFTPHVTLAYVPVGQPPQVDMPDKKITFSNVELAWGEDTKTYPLKGKTMAARTRKIEDDRLTRSLREAPLASVTPDGGFLLSGIVIAEGVSANGNNYTLEALETGKEVFIDRPIYADHPSRSEESDRPERTIRDLVGRLSENPDDFWVEAGSDGVHVLRFKNGRLSKTADWLAVLIQEGIAGDMSINAMGSGEEREGMFCVDAFTEATSLDFVTQAAAGGLGELESVPNLGAMTVAQLASARPDLVNTLATRERNKAYGERDELLAMTQALHLEHALNAAGLIGEEREVVRRLVEAQLVEQAPVPAETEPEPEDDKKEKPEPSPKTLSLDEFLESPAAKGVDAEAFRDWLGDDASQKLTSDDWVKKVARWQKAEGEQEPAEAEGEPVEEVSRDTMITFVCENLIALAEASPNSDHVELAGALADRYMIYNQYGYAPDWLIQAAHQVIEGLALEATGQGQVPTIESLARSIQRQLSPPPKVSSGRITAEGRRVQEVEWTLNPDGSESIEGNGRRATLSPAKRMVGTYNIKIVDLATQEVIIDQAGYDERGARKMGEDGTIYWEAYRRAREAEWTKDPDGSESIEGNGRRATITPMPDLEGAYSVLVVEQDTGEELINLSGYDEGQARTMGENALTQYKAALARMMRGQRLPAAPEMSDAEYGARTVSAGTLASLTGFKRYDDLDPIHHAFVAFVVDRPNRFASWIEAWREFAGLHAHEWPSPRLGTLREVIWRAADSSGYRPLIDWMVNANDEQEAQALFELRFKEEGDRYKGLYQQWADAGRPVYQGSLLGADRHGVGAVRRPLRTTDLYTGDHMTLSNWMDKASMRADKDRNAFWAWVEQQRSDLDLKNDTLPEGDWIQLHGDWSAGRMASRRRVRTTLDTITFPAGTPARCNRCDTLFDTPKDGEARRHNQAAYRFETMMTSPECDHMDAHYVYISDLPPDSPYREGRHEARRQFRSAMSQHEVAQVEKYMREIAGDHQAIPGGDLDTSSLIMATVTQFPGADYAVILELAALFQTELKTSGHILSPNEVFASRRSREGHRFSREVMFGGWEPALSDREMRSFEQLGAYTVSGDIAAPNLSYPDFPGSNPPTYKRGLATPNDPYSKAWIVQASHRSHRVRSRESTILNIVDFQRIRNVSGGQLMGFRGWYSGRHGGTDALDASMTLDEWDRLFYEYELSAGLIRYDESRRAREDWAWSPAQEEYKGYTIEAVGQFAVIYAPGSRQAVWELSITDWADTVEEAKAWIDQQGVGLASRRGRHSTSANRNVRVAPGFNWQEAPPGSGRPVRRPAREQEGETVPEPPGTIAPASTTLEPGDPAVIELPPDAAALPEEAQMIWLETYITYLDGGEVSAMHRAWTAVYDMGWEQDQSGRWTQTNSGVEDVVISDPSGEVEDIMTMPEAHRRHPRAGRRARPLRAGYTDYVIYRQRPNWPGGEEVDYAGTLPQAQSMLSDMVAMDNEIGNEYWIVGPGGERYGETYTSKRGRPRPMGHTVREVLDSEMVTEWKFTGTPFVKRASGGNAGMVHAWLTDPQQGFLMDDVRSFGEWKQIMTGGYPGQWDPNITLASRRPRRRRFREGMQACEKCGRLIEDWERIYNGRVGDVWCWACEECASKYPWNELKVMGEGGSRGGLSASPVARYWKNPYPQFASRRPRRRRTREATFAIIGELAGGPYGPEEIDETDDLDEARTLVYQYQFSFGANWKIWIEENGVVVEALRPRLAHRPQFTSRRPRRRPARVSLNRESPLQPDDYGWDYPRGREEALRTLALQHLDNARQTPFSGYTIRQTTRGPVSVFWLTPQECRIVTGGGEVLYEGPEEGAIRTLTGIYILKASNRQRASFHPIWGSKNFVIMGHPVGQPNNVGEIDWADTIDEAAMLLSGYKASYGPGRWELWVEDIGGDVVEARRAGRSPVRRQRASAGRLGIAQQPGLHRLRTGIVEKPASELKVGDEIYERGAGGMAFEIKNIEPRGDKLLLTIYSGFTAVNPAPFEVKSTDMIQVWEWEESARPVVTREQEDKDKGKEFPPPSEKPKEEKPKPPPDEGLTLAEFVKAEKISDAAAFKTWLADAGEDKAQTVSQKDWQALYKEYQADKPEPPKEPKEEKPEPPAVTEETIQRMVQQGVEAIRVQEAAEVDQRLVMGMGGGSSSMSTGEMTDAEFREAFSSLTDDPAVLDRLVASRGVRS